MPSMIFTQSTAKNCAKDTKINCLVLSSLRASRFASDLRVNTFYALEFFIPEGFHYCSKNQANPFLTAERFNYFS